MKRLGLLSMLCFLIFGCGKSEDVASMRKEIADLKNQTAMRKEIADLKNQLASLKHQTAGNNNEPPRLVISREKYVIERLDEITVVVKVNGRVRNKGTIDAGNVVITTDCNECRRTTDIRAWVDASAVQAFHKGEIINHLGAGDKEDFEYIVALFVIPSTTADLPKLPKGLKTRVVSFDPVK